MTKHSSAKNQRQEIVKIMGAGIFLTTIFSILSCGATLSESSSWKCWPEAGSLSIGGIMLLLSLTVQRRIRRAYKIYVLYAGVATTTLIPTGRLMVHYANISKWPPVLVILVAIGTTLVGAFLFLVYQRHLLKSARAYNMESGKLDIKRGLWDLTIPLRLYRPDTERLWQIWGRILLPLAPVAGLFALNTVKAEWRDVWFVMLSFLLLYIDGLIITFQLAISSELQALEKEFGKPLLILSD
jgi:hypothetical protein